MPIRSQQQDRETEKKRSRRVLVGGGFCGEFDSSVHEGWSGVGVAETVDVGVKNDLMRAHVVVLKDGGESVVLVGEPLVTPVGVCHSNEGNSGCRQEIRRRG